MPALQLLGRRWSLAADDLPFPAIAALLFHTTYTVIDAIAVATLDNPSDCELGTKYLAYYAGLLGIDALQLFSSIILLVFSTQGKATTVSHPVCSVTSGL